MIASESAKAIQDSLDEAKPKALLRRQEKCEFREIYVLGPSSLDSSQPQEGGRLYLFSEIECKPLVAELRLADSSMSFLSV
jgi:hypothetical protein